MTDIDYPTTYKNKGINGPALVRCPMGTLFKYSSEGRITAYLWNTLSREKRLELLKLHWRVCACDGFEDDRSKMGMPERHSYGEGQGSFVYIPIRTEDLPSRQSAEAVDMRPRTSDPRCTCGFWSILCTCGCDPIKLPSTTSKISYENTLQGDPVMSTFALFTVAVYDPVDGSILVKPDVVAAKDVESAQNKAVGRLAQNLPEGKELDEVLDSVRITVRPF